MSVQPPVKAMPSQRLTVWPAGVLLDESVVAGLLHLLRDLSVGLIPGNVFPVGGSGTAHLRLEQAAVVENVLFERRALGAERAAIDGVIGIALDVHYLRDGVLGLVAERVDDHAAAHGTIRAGAAGFAGAGNFEALRLGVERGEIKSEGGKAGAAKNGAFEKSPARELHHLTPWCAFLMSGVKCFADAARPPLQQCGTLYSGSASVVNWRNTVEADMVLAGWKISIGG